MSVEQFLQDFKPGEESNEDTLAELSGIANSEATQLSTHWLSWTDDEVLDLHTKLSDLAEEDSSMEFECVFKVGLRHRDGRVRAVAAHGLAESGDTSAASRILDLMDNDEDIEVRTAAATAVGSFATLAAEGRLSERIRNRIVDSLANVLQDGSSPTELWRRSLESAGALGDVRFNRYIDQAKQSDAPDFKRSALVAMARTSDPRWLDFVTQELDSEDSSVRFEAVNALGEIGDEADAFYLEEPLDDQDLMVQLAAVAAAEKIAGSTAKQLLRVATESPEPGVSRAASEALLGIENEDKLIHTVTPEMASQGMFGASAADGSDSSVPYDAAEREGWSHVDEEGRPFHAADNFREDDDDPLASLMDYEAAPGQYEDDD